MLALSTKHISGLANGRLTFRALADVVGTIRNESALSIAPPATPKQRLSKSVRVLTEDRIPVREDHGLYAFFRRKEDPDLIGDARYEVVETPEKVQRVTGRSWRASELRLKSFRDLHTLWYVLLRERNTLATQKEEVRRMGVIDTETQVSLVGVHQCRKSMARIKAVINERRLAYEGAVKIAEQQKEEHYDKELLQHQTAQFRAERKYLRRRRDRKAWKETEKLELAREATTQGAPAEIAVIQEAAAQNAVPKFVTTPLATARRSVSESVVDPSPTKHTRTEAQWQVVSSGSPDAGLQQPRVGSVENTESEILTATQPKAVDAATAGLFGDIQTSDKVGKPRR